MTFTDSHCHLGSGKFLDSEIPGLLDSARLAGVRRIVTLATSLEDVERNLEIAKAPDVQAALGIHPCDVHNAPDDAVERLPDFLGDDRVCAVGETGLDYFHAAPEGWVEAEFHERQRLFLRAHFAAARDAGLNIVIHTRDREGHQSFTDAYDIYRDYAEDVRAVFHCFISGWELGERVIAAGGLLSFGGVATFKKAGEVLQTAGRCPKGSFMLETDAPYLSPTPLRGKRNEPAHMRFTAKRIAELRGESLDELSEHTEKAADSFFRWDSESV